jgi:hypothetical protein
VNTTTVALVPGVARTKKHALLFSLLALLTIIALATLRPAASAENQASAFSLPDFTMQSVLADEFDGRPVYLFDVTVNDPAASELGYGRVRAWFDPTLQAVRQVVFFNLAENPVLTIHIDEFEVDGDTMRIRHAEVIDHRTGTTTAFSKQQLRSSARRGVPKVYF